MKKLKLVVICLLALFAFSSGAYAQYSNSYIEQAKVFYELRLYMGTNANRFEPSLEEFLDRETAAVFLIRLIGQAKRATNMSDYQINIALNPYTDKDTVSIWARSYVALAAKLGLFPDITGNSLMPKRLIDGKTFAGMLLKCLKHEIPEEFLSISAYINSYLGGISPSDAKYVNDKILTKNDMIGIVWESLDVKLPHGATFLEYVVEANDIQQSVLTRADFRYSNDMLIPPAFRVSSLYNREANIHMHDGTLFIGQSEYGIPNGYGIVNYPDGSVYEGYVLNGKREGEGRFLRSDGFVYTGGWSNDNMNGRGEMIWSNGDHYTGDIVDGSFQGKGTMVWANGDTYTGEWWASEFHGKGKFVWATGNYYEGDWHTNSFHGYGVFRWASGEIYEGQWQHGKKNGYGRNVEPDGTVTEGIWQDDVYVGQG
ncbi:MAG: MORN repeat protein [Firmicutes bacterium ADurb.Bin193]|nr:MAG: MORN repeat protein [Firmicutes bacterium ADurb.Bin193]